MEAEELSKLAEAERVRILEEDRRRFPYFCTYCLAASSNAATVGLAGGKRNKH